MSRVATIDFETASQVPGGIDAGSYAYWEHPTTEVLCLCVIVRMLGFEVERITWIPAIVPEGGASYALTRLRLLADDPSVTFEAHKADFEQAGWEIWMVGKLGFPALPPERWDDTMARCYYRGVPGALDKAAIALGLEEQKDKEGRSLTLSLSKPLTKKTWLEEFKPEGVTLAEWGRQYTKDKYDRRPSTLRRVARYCMQDCVTELAVGDAVGPLSAYERRVWELDQRMNQRGLAVDLDYVRASKAVVDVAKVPLLAEFASLTGDLRPSQSAKLLAWCNAQGLAIENLQKDNLKALGIRGLDDDDEEDSDDDDVALPLPQNDARMPEAVRRALSIRAVLASSSLSKLDRILECVSRDGRVRYTVQYHGAGTGRWAGRLFQPQNFPRGKIVGGHDPDALVSAISYATRDPRGAVDYLSMLFGDPIAAVASGLRHAIVSGPGQLFEVGDFAGIEARIVLALAGQYDQTERMAAGEDVYCHMAEVIYKRPVTKHDIVERQAGKSAVLGCGFGLGWASFIKKFMPTADEAFARTVVEAYRKSWAPLVPKLWYALEEAALKAVFDKGEATAYGITYKWHPGWLACILPDGQIMWYRDPEVVSRPMPWNKDDIRLGWAYHAYKNGQWKRVYAYGGLLCENVVQKIARGLLCEAMFRLEENGHPLVLTVHDECVSEVPALVADMKDYTQIMAEPTRYSREIRVPISVESWQGSRYRK